MRLAFYHFFAASLILISVESVFVIQLSCTRHFLWFITVHLSV